MIGTERKKSKCYRLFHRIDRACLYMSKRFIRYRWMYPISDGFFMVGLWAFRQKEKLK